MKGSGWIIAIIIIVLLAMLGSCDDSSSPYEGYSDTYKTDAKYRSDVSGIADAFGVSEWEVDSKINAVTGGR